MQITCTIVINKEINSVFKTAYTQCKMKLDSNY